MRVAERSMDVRATGPAASGGMAGSLRALMAALGELLRVRGALVGAELREEIERRKQWLVMAVLAAVLLHMALLVLTALAVVAFWDTHRISALAAMAALYLAFGAGLLVRLRVAVAASPPPFAASLGELHRDLAQLRSPR